MLDQGWSLERAGNSHLGTVPSRGLFIVLRLGVVVYELQFCRADHATTHPVAWGARTPRAGGAGISSTAATKQKRTVSCQEILCWSINSQHYVWIKPQHKRLVFFRNGVTTFAGSAHPQSLLQWHAFRRHLCKSLYHPDRTGTLQSPQSGLKQRRFKTLIKSNYLVNSVKNQGANRPNVKDDLHISCLALEMRVHQTKMHCLTTPAYTAPAASSVGLNVCFLTAEHWCLHFTDGVHVRRKQPSGWEDLSVRDGSAFLSEPCGWRTKLKLINIQWTCRGQLTP